MRLKHATTAQDDQSEAVASAFVQSSSADPPSASSSGKEIEDFVKEFKDLRKTYHKRVIWGERWTTGQVRWTDN
jgi:ESCRT-I complex subunit VPS37